MNRAAVLSLDGRYRYRLERRWSEDPTATWVMLNPSTADAEVDDQTVRRCVSFSTAAGYGRLIVVNLYALRATNPAELKTAADPVGPSNPTHVRTALQEAQLIVAAWGSHPMGRRSTIRLKLAIMAPPGVPVVCLGRSARGDPFHPARLGDDRLFLPFTLP